MVDSDMTEHLQNLNRDLVWFQKMDVLEKGFKPVARVNVCFSDHEVSMLKHINFSNSFYNKRSDI